MFIRPALPSDLPRIAALERAPMAREFFGQWSDERHLATMTGGDALYYVNETAQRELQAYAILRGSRKTLVRLSLSALLSPYRTVASAAASLKS
jgi:hypothetical protein